jgi:Suppressor of fused protein (SUFU)
MPLGAADLPPNLTSAQHAVVRHVAGFFADRSAEVFGFSEGPTEQRLAGFHELCVSPAHGDRRWMYVSCGAWDAVHIGGHGLEFFLLAPERHQRHARIVAMSAYYHANPDQSYRLDVGHTVPLGEPWLPGSALDHLLVSLPYPYGPEFEICRWDDGHTRILWLLPITKSERDFRAEHGLEALEQHFDDTGLHYWDPQRSPVV